MGIHLKDIFTASLPGDPDHTNRPRAVAGACYSFVNPKGMMSPKLILYSPELAKELGFSKEFCESEDFAKLMVGNDLFEGSKPFAMCYGGHQFGHWANQLGDGRAINLGEVAVGEKHQTLQLKGAGPTPYSRSADGLAVLRSSIREFLCSEAMFYLGVPTTRALSLTLTGEEVLRDMMYNGNADYEPGAVVCRVAPNFIRFGNFEILSARGDIANLQKLADYTILHYYPHLIGEEKKYLLFFQEVSNATLNMILHWQRVGFVHGVMNTDNMSISSLTIDYGPYGWIDDYDPDWTPNTTDLPGKRYRFGHQPQVAQWNLYKLANALFPLINEEAQLSQIINDFHDQYQKGYLEMMGQKLGLYERFGADSALMNETEELLVFTRMDMTIFFRSLSQVSTQSSIQDDTALLSEAFYNNDEKSKEKLVNWLSRYKERLSLEKVSIESRAEKMSLTNPKYVLRNYMAQMAIDEATKGEYTLLKELFELLKNPYDEQPESEKWFAKRPEWARSKVGSSMLSCSS